LKSENFADKQAQSITANNTQLRINYSSYLYQ
jgi:hypothetical protein